MVGWYMWSFFQRYSPLHEECISIILISSNHAPDSGRVAAKDISVEQDAHRQRKPMPCLVRRTSKSLTRMASSRKICIQIVIWNLCRKFTICSSYQGSFIPKTSRKSGNTLSGKVGNSHIIRQEKWKINHVSTKWCETARIVTNCVSHHICPILKIRANPFINFCVMFPRF